MLDFHELGQCQTTIAAAINRETLDIAEVAGRNSVVRINWGDRVSFMKHGRDTSSAEFGVKREIDVYAMLSSCRRFDALSRYLPSWHQESDKLRSRILITQSSEDALCLHDYITLNGHFPYDVGYELGTFLARLHLTDPDGIIDHLGYWEPEITGALEPTTALLASGSHELQSLTQIIQRDAGLVAILKHVRDSPPNVAILHGDLSWRNSVIQWNGSDSQQWTLRIVDWESLRLGPPMWEVGMAIGQSLKYWIERVDQHDLRLTPELLDPIGPGTSAVILAYARARSINPADPRFLLEVIRYAAAALLHIVAERCADGQKSTSWNTHAMLALASQVFESPLATLQALGYDKQLQNRNSNSWSHR